MPKLIWNGSLLLAILSGLLTNAAHALRVSERLSFRLPVLGNTMLYDLRDEVYYFPANDSRREGSVYLPLRRWDMIFTGDLRNTPDSPVDQENINHIKP